MNAKCLNRSKPDLVRTSAGDVYRTRKKLVDSVHHILRRSFPSFRFDLQCSKEIGSYGVQGKWWVLKVSVDGCEKFCVHQREWPGHLGDDTLESLLGSRVAEFT